MSSNILVSICIAAYNAERYIAESLNSILQQSYHPIEIIVVNDGSTDRTSEILHNYKSTGIKVVEQDNKGQCSAANRAYSMATGDYIKFFDADDVLSRDFIKSQIEVLAGRSDIIASAAWGRFYNDDINTFKLSSEKVWKDMKPIDWLVESFMQGPNMMQCGLWLIPREVLNKSGLWDERLSLINDFDFFIRVLLAAKEIKFASCAVLYYRSGINTSLSRQKSRMAYESAFLSTQLGVQHLLNFENSERVKRVCANNMRMWQYEFYPNQRDLYNKTKSRIKQLGGSDFPFPAGGYTKLLCRLLGWKTTKIIKNLIMTWKLFLGQSLSSFEETLIKTNNSFIKNHYPFGRNWMFDLKRILNEHPQVIVDAGANIGEVSVELNNWFPKAKIYAFEPVKKTFSRLVNNTKNETYIKCINEALGSKNEKVTITLNNEHTINSLKVVPSDENIIGSEEINIIRLDDYLKNQNIDHIDILKIDVEGFEFEVLEGCGSLIENNIQCILLEVGYEREPTKVHFSDVDKFMEDKGLQLCGIYDTRRSLLDKRKLWYSNNLYIKNDLLI